MTILNCCIHILGQPMLHSCQIFSMLTNIWMFFISIQIALECVVMCRRTSSILHWVSIGEIRTASSLRFVDVSLVESEFVWVIFQTRYKSMTHCSCFGMLCVGHYSGLFVGLSRLYVHIYYSYKKNGINYDRESWQAQLIKQWAQAWLKLIISLTRDTQAWLDCCMSSSSSTG